VARRSTEAPEELPEGYTRVVAPSGSESIVPDAILESLLDSGYTKK